MPCSPRGRTGAAVMTLAFLALGAMVPCAAATAPAEKPAPVKKSKASKADAFASRYAPKGEALAYPTLDDALLGVMIGGPPPRSPAQRTVDVPGKIQPVLGDVIRRPDDMPARATASTTIGMTREQSGDSFTAVMRPLPVTPLPAAARGPVDERRYSELYRKTDPTRGWTGPGRRVDYVSVRPEVTRPDRWRAGFPDYAVHTRGKAINPYEQNILKGDYPIIGDRTFLVLTGISDTLVEERHLPTPSNIPALRAGSFRTFGKPGQHAFKQQFSFTANVFNGDTAFEPPRWQFRVTPVFNVDNTLRLQEVGATEPDVRRGTERERFDVAIQELFGEVRIAVTSPFFDFASMRLGRQFFNSDFRGFMFSNFNQGIRLFGNGASNRNAYNLVYFDMVEYEGNSELLRGDPNPDRGQGVLMANFTRQDFANIEGYTLGVNFHANRDDPSFLFDVNGFLARPDPVGRFRTHKLESKYVGLVGDGHIGWLNLTHAFYHAFGTDSFNNLAGRALEIDAQMAALEASVDRDWLRYKLSLFYSSGDNNPTDGSGQGFDTILDDPNFAGGPFSFWVRQGLRLQGVGLKQRVSLVPDLRTSKLQGQANFVNPGLQLFGLGTDVDLTPKVKLLLNANLLRFDTTESLQLFLFQKTVPRGIGLDYSLGAQYRPELNQNIVIDLGLAGFLPGDGFRAIYDTDKGLYQAFTNVKLTF